MTGEAPDLSTCALAEGLERGAMCRPEPKPFMLLFWRQCLDHKLGV